jgi:steroid 5-alpha reductase family enzyme
MVLAWNIALNTGKSGWIDATWSFSTGLVGAAVSLFPMSGDSHFQRQLLVAILAGVWSLRLAIHIAVRTRTGGDDPRYAQLRMDWGPSYRRRLFWFLQIQAAAAAVLVLTIFTAAHNPRPALGLAEIIGVAIMAIGVVGEGIADWQLAHFRMLPSNKGKVCDAGLWSWSRHPNYFFEWITWLAYPAIAIDFSSSYQIGWLSLTGPALMYWLLVHASGIPLLEAHMVRSRGEAFRVYQARVSAFVPLPPKRREL